MAQTKEEKTFKNTIISLAKRICASLIIGIIPYILFRRHISDLPMAVLIGFQVTSGFSFLLEYDREEFKSENRYIFAILFNVAMPFISILLMILMWDSYKIWDTPKVSASVWFWGYFYAICGVKDNYVKKNKSA